MTQIYYTKHKYVKKELKKQVFEKMCARIIHVRSKPADPRYLSSKVKINKKELYYL